MCGTGDIPSYATKTERVNHPLLPKITDTRLDRFFGGPYASQHLDKLLDRARYGHERHVRMSYWSAPGDTKPGFQEAVSAIERKGQHLARDHVFGLSWTNHWIKVELTIPEAWREGSQQLIFEFDPSCEALIFLPDGIPLHGITGGPNTIKDGRPGEQEDRRVEHIIPVHAVQAGSYAVYIEVTCNGMFGLGPYRYQTPDPNRTFPLVSADIVVPNLEARGLRTDFRILMEVARHPDAKLFGLGQRALRACDDIMNAFRRVAGDGADNFAGADAMIGGLRSIAWEVLGDLDEESLQKVCVRDTQDRDAKVWAIGHWWVFILITSLGSHIDTAWLWRYTQTQQKIARSWTTQCDLMDRWPNHQFAASSAQQYLWLEQLYPKGFERVKEYIQKGRFHYVGGAWLEHDCMMPSGESLARQYLYGQRYFRSRFGEYCREAWLPDTFGYASQLPQILRQAGLNYFFTQKISWNNINVFPYNSFNWAGIDGSQVLAHMTPVDGYNGQCTYGELVKGIQNNKNLGTTDQCLFLFGNGDGGGGPTPLMMEKLERLSSLGMKNPEVPPVKMGSPVDFFDDLCKRTAGGATLPTWRGELYLEYHRGVGGLCGSRTERRHTPRKLPSRKGIRTWSASCATSNISPLLHSLQNSDYVYPKSELDEMWQDLLLTQFHDCLPGTTIRTVVEDNIEIYERRGGQAKSLIKQALQSLQIRQNAVTIVDPLRLDRQGVIGSSGKLSWYHTSSGSGSLSQPPELLSPKAGQEGDTWTLSNPHYSLTIANGRITSVVDVRLERELIIPGPGANNAGLVLYEDYPLTYDAWDAEIYHLQSFEAIRFDTVTLEEEPLRATLVATAKFGKSSARLRISLDAVTPKCPNSLIRVETHIEWHEEHKFLKFALPVDVHSSYATYGTQFGTIDRPTHRNTTLDQAKFEVCAHGFADLSEAGYGVAIACRDKYGYAVEGNTMRLSLIRAPTSPDPHTDQGEHDFMFAIMPHRGHFTSSNVIKDTLKFCNPSYVVEAGLKSFPQFTVMGDQCAGIVLETIKRGEDDVEGVTKTVILRLYEAMGGRAKGVLNITGVKVSKAEWVSILEEPYPASGPCDVTQLDGAVAVRLDFGCFEIKSLKLYV